MSITVHRDTISPMYNIMQQVLYMAIGQVYLFKHNGDCPRSVAYTCGKRVEISRRPYARTQFLNRMYGFKDIHHSSHRCGCRRYAMPCYTALSPDASTHRAAAPQRIAMRKSSHLSLVNLPTHCAMSNYFAHNSRPPRNKKLLLPTVKSIISSPQLKNHE